jgi:hypothetical protein
MIDWDRILLIAQGTRFRKVAWKIARLTGASVGDVRQTMIEAIAKRASREPTFLEQTESYVVTWGYWRASRNPALLDQTQPESYYARMHLGKRVAQVELSDGIAAFCAAPAPEPDDGRPCLADLEIALMALPDELRDIAETMLSAPERFLAGGHHGNVNKAALSREFGRSEWWARNRLTALRCALAPLNVTGAIYGEAA